MRPRARIENRNRLASVTRNGQSYGAYLYNALEQLVARSTGTAPGGPVGTIHYIYDRDGHLIAEIDGLTGTTLREYIWLPSNDNGNDTPAEDMGLAANDNSPADMPLAVIDVTGSTTTTSFIHTDHLGRPIRMTNAAKATVWQAAYKPWGEVQSITGTIANNLRFPGQYFQIETNLAYNWHRTYDTVTGRYTQPDPLRFVDGPSVYAYAKSSPFMYVDPKGQFVFLVPLVVVAPWVIDAAIIATGAVAGMVAGQIIKDLWPNCPPAPNVTPAITTPPPPGGGKCECTCRAGDANVGGQLGYVMVSSIAKKCSIAAADACKAAVNRVAMSNIHHVVAQCSDGKRYSGSGNLAR